VGLEVTAQPIDREIELSLTEASPQQQSAIVSQFASEQIAEALKADQQALGQPPRYTITIDGHANAALETARADSTITVEFQLFNDVLTWIDDQLIQHSPVGQAHDPHPGLYQKSHELLADGVLTDPQGVVPYAEEYVFVNTAPYARKIETGESSQAPDGVYQAVAVLAARRFGNIAKITFEYRAPVEAAAGGARNLFNPAVVVKTRGG